MQAANPYQAPADQPVALAPASSWPRAGFFLLAAVLLFAATCGLSVAGGIIILIAGWKGPSWAADATEL